MDFRLTDDQELLRRSIREFAESEIRPHVREWDEAQQFPRELLPKLAALGLMGIQFPEEYGGAAMSSVDYCICIEELARVDPSVCLSVAAHNGLGAAHIAMFGTEEQKQQVPRRRWRAGEQLAAWGLTEASSGSDAGAMRTTATRDGDVLGDQRHEAVHHARPLRRPDRRHGGHQPRARAAAASPRSSSSAGRRVPRRQEGRQARDARERDERGDLRELPRAGVADARAEGQGFINALQVLDAGRIGIAALAVGLAQGAYEAARSYAFERKQFGQPIGTFQSIRAKLVDAATRIEAARLLTYRAAAMKDAGQRTTLEAAMAKLYSSEIAVRAAEDGVQIHGGYGFVKDYPAEKYFRDVKLTTIGEGTSEIQRLVIARQLLAA